MLPNIMKFEPLENKPTLSILTGMIDKESLDGMINYISIHTFNTLFLWLKEWWDSDGRISPHTKNVFHSSSESGLPATPLLCCSSKEAGLEYQRKKFCLFQKELSKNVSWKLPIQYSKMNTPSISFSSQRFKRWHLSIFRKYERIPSFGWSQNVFIEIFIVKWCL